MKLICKTIAAAALALSATAASAAVVDNGVYTTDTNLGLDFLDVGLIHDSYGNFLAGVTYAGRTWILATTAQIASVWSDATGLALTTADVESGDNDMGAAATNILISLFDGVTSDLGAVGEAVIGDYAVSNYYNFVAGGGLAVHSVFDDSHFSTSQSGIQGAWLVSRSVAAVPVPAAGFLLIGAIGGLAALRRRRA